MALKSNLHERIEMYRLQSIRNLAIQSMIEHYYD